MALVCTLVIVGLGIGAAGTAAADTTDGNATLVLDQPDEAIPTDGSGEIDLRVEGADNGVGAYELTLLVVDPDTLTLETAEVSGEGDDGPLVDVERTDGDDELLLTLSVTLLDATHDPADEITLASLTVAGHETGEAVVSIADVEEFADQDSERYDTSTTDTTVTVQEADDTTQAPNDLDALLDAMDGTGTEDDPYVITNASELQAINADSDAHYVLGDDIDASGTSEWNDGAGFDPIVSFSGSFDGSGHTITGLTIDRNKSSVGLFNDTSGSEITAVSLEAVNINGDSFAVGGLVGTHVNGKITNSSVTGTVKGDFYVGGLVGYNTGQDGSTIEGSYATGNVKGNFYPGGLVGATLKGTVRDSYATGNVTLIEGAHAGGLVGKNRGGTISQSYAIATVTAVDSDSAGGLVGTNSYGDRDGVVEDSYWNINTTGQEDGFGSDVGYVFDADGLTTVEMIGEGAFDADNIDAFDQETWETVSDGSPPSADGDGYPILQALEPEPQIQIPAIDEGAPELSGLDIDGQGETATVDEGEFINDIEVDVANVGEQESSFTLELVIEDSDGVEIEQTLTTLEIEPGESRNIEFIPDVTDLDAGQYTVTIADSDGVSAVTGTLTIDAESEPASFEVDIDEEATETEITQGDNLSVVATITNTGDVTGVRNISAEVNSPDSTAGMGTDLGSLELQSGESDTIEWTSENVSLEPGEYFIDIDSEDTSDSVDVTILEADEPTEPVSTVSVDPDTETVLPNETVTADVRINTTANVTATDVLVDYDPDFFEVESVEFGPFLGQDGTETIGDIPTDEDAGVVTVYEARQVEDGVSGEGVLATVTLRASDDIDDGAVTDLGFDDVRALDENDDEIAVETETATIDTDADGTPEVNTTVLAETVHAGSTVDVRVTAEPRIPDRPVVNATVSANAPVVDRQQVSDDTWVVTLEFENSTWDGGSDGSYATTPITATAITDRGDTRNETVETVVHMPGDVTGDGQAQLFDLRFFALAYEATENDSDYNAAADFTNDGEVGIADLTLLGQNWRTAAWDDENTTAADASAIDENDLRSGEDISTVDHTLAHPLPGEL